MGSLNTMIKIKLVHVSVFGLKSTRILENSIEFNTGNKISRVQCMHWNSCNMGYSGGVEKVRKQSARKEESNSIVFRVNKQDIQKN